MDIVGGSRPLAEQRGGDSPKAKFANCYLHTFPLRHKKSLIWDGVAAPCNSTTCTQFTRIRQIIKTKRKIFLPQDTKGLKTTKQPFYKHWRLVSPGYRLRHCYTEQLKNSRQDCLTLLNVAPEKRKVQRIFKKK